MGEFFFARRRKMLTVEQSVKREGAAPKVARSEASAKPATVKTRQKKKKVRAEKKELQCDDERKTVKTNGKRRPVSSDAVKRAPTLLQAKDRVKHATVAKKAIRDGRAWVRSMRALVDDASFLGTSGGRELKSKTQRKAVKSTILRSTVCTIVFVSVCGSDTPCPGQPYLTLDAAIAAAGVPSYDVPLLVLVGAGTTYPAFHLPANCYVIGAGYTATCVAAVSLDLASWNTAQTQKGGMQDVGVLGTSTFDYYTATLAQSAKIYLTGVRLYGSVLWRAFRPAGQQLLMIGCDVEGNFVQRGGAVFWQGNSTSGSIDVYAADPNPLVTPALTPAELHTSCALYDGAQISPNESLAVRVRIHNTGSAKHKYAVTADIAAFNCGGTLDVIGNGETGLTNVYCSAIGIPESSLVAVTNKGALVNTTFANAIGYVPLEKCRWIGPAPRTVQEALDRIAAAYGPF
jgi:hypothetical protein